MFYDRNVFLEEDDQCVDCKHYLNGVSCPLLQSLAVGVCSLEEESVRVSGCGLYVQYERHLKVVRDDVS